MNETSKANKRRAKDPLFQKVFKGHGIDIGGGSDPLIPSKDFPNMLSVKKFDTDVGNAQYILEYEKPESYDFVYSSHCLEHMLDPYGAIESWCKLVKLGGYLILVVPDEDLYEQGVFPSRFNSSHRFTFTIGKPKSWCFYSINIDEACAIALQIPSVFNKWRKVKCNVESTGYDFRKMCVGIDQTEGDVEANIEVVLERK